MTRIAVRPLLLLAAALTIIPTVTPAATAADDPLMTDLRLVAAAQGWSVEQALAHHTVAERFGQVQQRVATMRPDLYAGAALAATPGAAPTLYVKGKADQLVRDTVAAAGVPVTVVEGRALSWLELEARSQDLHRRLAALGFRDLVTSFDETTGTVEAAVTRVPGLPGTPTQVLALLPAELRDARLALLDAPAGRDLHAFGGMWVRDDGVNECTSGWAVTDGVTTGVTTAAHCNGINQISEPGVGVHALAWQDEHAGAWGDVEWHTSTHVEPAQFYADAGDLRDVDSVEPRAGITVGEAVCAYGRSSNVRDCELVFRTSVSCTVSGIPYSRLVAMQTQDTLIGGDSGGGWSVGTRAYGSVKGACTISAALRDVWSVADLYDEALGVTVITT